MSKCDVCGGRAQLRLCITHQLTLRDTLRDLPWWLDRLAEAAVGDVKLSDNGRRGSRASELDEYAGPDGADKLAQALQAGKLRRDRLLATGRVNAKASRLHNRARNDITTWVRHLCETRGIDYPSRPWPPPRTVHVDFIGPLPPGWFRINHDIKPPDPPLSFYARWLATNAHAIASDENAKQCHDTMIDLTDRIRRIVNRPTPPKFCGPCPTPLTEQERTKLVADGDEDRENCHTSLYAPPKADRVTCPRCKLEYDVKELSAWWYEQCGDKLFTIRELVDWVLPQLNEPVSDKWLYKWSKRGDLEIAGWSADADIMFRLCDVRELRQRTSTRFHKQKTSV